MGVAEAMIAGSLANAAMGSRSARKAAKTQAEAANAANETELQMYNQSRADLEPWRVAGQNALEQLMRMQGFRKVETPRPKPAQTVPFQSMPAPQAQQQAPVNPNSRRLVGGAFIESLFGKPAAPSTSVKQATQQVMQQIAEQDQPEGPSYTWEAGGDPMAALQLDPGYAFRLREGQNALSRMLAARGMRNSGAALREATRYNQGLASQEFADAYNRLAGLSGTGQTTSNQLAALGSNYASQYGQNLGQAANARASGYVASGQARQNALSDLMGIGLLKNQGFFK